MTVVARLTGQGADECIECRCLLCGREWSAYVVYGSHTGGYDGAQLVPFCACYDTLLAPTQILPREMETQP